MAADPTYPLYPILSLLSATLLLGILTTNFIRHSWNLGVTFLCFWLFWNNLSSTIGAIVWSDNADIKLYFWCDIVSHLNLFTHIVKPACTLILTRRLYKIASLRSLVPESRKEKIVDAAIEWCLGLGLPALVTGAFYYIVQEARFEILEGIGCTTAVISSGLSVLLIESPGIILPSISTLFYCPKIIYVFFRHSRDTNEFLQTNGFMSRSGYSHILALGCLDILLTLPFGIIQVVGVTHAVPPGASLPLYPGWRRTHSNWKPVSSLWNDVEQGGALQMFCLNVGRSSPVILAFAISAVFGFTGEARAMYRRGIRALMNMTKIKSLEPDKEAGTRSSTFVAVYGARTEDGNAGREFQTSVLKADSFLARSPISDADQYIPSPLDNGCTVGAPWLLESNYSEDTVASGAGNKETSRSVESQNDKGGGYHARRASYNSTDVPHFVDSSRSDTGATAPRSSAFSEVV